MALSHGTNDAQKQMGIIALSLYTATQAGMFRELPDWMGFLVSTKFEVHTWIKVVCALTMAAGTAAEAGGLLEPLGIKWSNCSPSMVLRRKPLPL